MHIFRSFQRDWPWWRWRQHWARRFHTTLGDRDSQTAMELPRAPSSPQERGRLEEAAAGGDLPTMVVATVEEAVVGVKSAARPVVMLGMVKVVGLEMIGAIGVPMIEPGCKKGKKRY